MTVKEIDVAHNIWIKSVPDLKVNTTRKKNIFVVGDLGQLPEELVKLHKNIHMTADMFFVNSIPFFLTLSRNIYFTAVNHLANRKVETIFKAFKDIYSYYLKFWFHITTIHSDVKFPHYKLWYTITYQGDPGSIPQLQMNTYQILNAK